MRVRGALQAAVLLATTLWPAAVWAEDERVPVMGVSEMKHIPRNLNYFEDSDVIISQDISEGNVYWSEDAGNTWKRVEAVPDGRTRALYMHEYESSRAYILTDGIQHYRTSDRGKTWEAFQTDAQMSLFQKDVLVFHADDPDRIIFNGMDCQGILCDEVAMYTVDGFSTAAKYMRGSTAGCWWAKTSPLFTTGEADLDKSRVLCIVRSPISPFRQDQRLLVSDIFFQAASSNGVLQEFEPNLDTDKEVQGVVNIAGVKKYLLAATTSMHTDEMALYVSDDAKKWHRAMFPADHHVREEAYTVLESTNYSIQVDVMTSRPSNPMGVMFTSNSNGTFFTKNIEHTNRDELGHVDFEKIQGIQGIFLLNKVDNWEAVEKDVKADKKVVSEITFDDGRTFEQVTAGGERIHLHSVTQLSNVGRVYSSSAPGLVMAIGNTGEYLKDYWTDGNLYVSDDAGRTWSLGRQGPHKYEFGDQGSILVAVRDSKIEDVGEVSYSLDHGLTWKTAPLPGKLQIRPYILTTTQDSSSLKFLLVGLVKEGESIVYKIIALNFDGLHEATCKDSDMEEWYARVDNDKRPTCLMGHTQRYYRRKKNAECFLRQEFKDPVVETTDCDCTDLDYECDYNFGKDASGECVPRAPLLAPEGACKDPEATFKGTSGWRKIPGNTCKSRSNEPKEQQKEWPCSAAANLPAKPATDKISHVTVTEEWKGDWTMFDIHYLERGASSSSDDETIIARPRRGKSAVGDILITHDHGKTWQHIEALRGEQVWLILPHRYFKDVVFFVTLSRKVVYSVDRGYHFHSFDAPYDPYPEDGDFPLWFHRDRKDWLLWLGKKCDSGPCYPSVSYSKDRGDHWETAIRYAKRCEFIGSRAYQYASRDEAEILCLASEREDQSADNPLQLVSTVNWFDSKEVRLERVIDFATMAEFIVAAVDNTDKKALAALASINGQEYAEAHFPANFKVSQQHEYTVLDSSTHAINLFVETERASDHRYGTILKSNSNGTSYVLSIAGVNCDANFYVDFEKMLGLEGVAMVNVVANQDETSAPKKLRTLISHNDGAEWAFLPPPAKDLEGKSFGCGPTGSETCALHIHGYTERADRKKTFSMDGAVGVMVGLGNVGPTLTSLNEADTFMTVDAGVTWKQVRKGRHMWSFGDQGSIIVLVRENEKTDEIYFSVDGGNTWGPFKFSEEKVDVLDLTSLLTGSSRNFLIWAKGSKGIFTVNIDFSGFSERVCRHDDDIAKSDYDLWSPKHPMQTDDCLFGHVSYYLRKKAGAKCYNDFKMKTLFSTENCTCTRQDYECDYNYELDMHGACHLVSGLQPLSPTEWCKSHPEAIEYYEPTGYRRLPFTTCSGGLERDKQSQPHACTGHEDDFNRAHPGPSGVAIFFAVTIPIAAAAAVGWWVWRNWSGKFGQIRLGEQSAGRGALDSDQPWIRYPVVVLAAAVAVIGALPLVAASAWRSAKGAAERWGWFDSGRGAWSRLSVGGAPRRFTTRDSFARGRGDYAVVDEDEGELLGEDSDEEV